MSRIPVIFISEDVPAKRKVPKIEKKEIQVLRKDEIEKLLTVIDQRNYLGVRDRSWRQPVSVK